MRFNFTGQVENLLPGLHELKAQHGFEISEGGGCTVEVVHSKDIPLAVSYQKKDNRAVITYSQPIYFFRAFGLLVENIGEDSYKIAEIPHFDTNGVMLDVSQGNAVINITASKELIRRMAVMGANMLMFYCEDSFTVEKQPYFGYMRPRYHEADIRELDDYAFQFGIELIPCIQTLAHLTDPLRWAAFEEIKEDADCLLVGEEKTYAFIEDLITAAVKPFRTKRIHIGMDEAYRLGRGEYLTRNGFVPPYKIMCDHLARVMEIVRKMGLKPMMWSDMFFTTLKDGWDYSPDNIIFTQEHIDSVPKDVQLVYWDYYKYEESMYYKYFDAHRIFGEPVMATGTWTYYGYGLNWGISERALHASMAACKTKGIKETFMTVWGDNGTECNIFAILPGLSLFSELSYCAERPSQEALVKRFEFTAGGSYQDFVDLRYIDETPGVEEGNYEMCNTAKSLMWQDILTGLIDKNIEGLPLNDHYSKWREKYEAAAERNEKYAFLFDMYAAVADVLSVKAELGLQITAAYKANDREAMRDFADVVLPDLAQRVKQCRVAHMNAWFYSYKPLGWDVHDMRYGSVLVRIQSAIDEIHMWLDGTLTCLEELDETRLLFHGEEGIPKFNNSYGFIASPSRIAPTA